MNAHQLRSVFLLFAIVVVSVSTAFSAPEKIDTTGNKPVEAVKKDTISKLDTAYVIVSIRIEGDTNKRGDIKPLRADFNKRIVIKIRGNYKPFENQDNDFVYINNIRMPYKVSFNCPCITGSKDSTFTLTWQLAKPDSSWNKWYGFHNDSLDVKVDVGTKLKQYTCTTDNNLRIKMFGKGGLVVASIFVIILVIISVLLAFFLKTNLIKDKSTADKKPYSLSRFQLLWWTVIIIGSYILLFAIRDDFALLSQSTLILLGISAMGSGFAAVVDYSQSDNNPNIGTPSQGFLIDILSDDNGISVHRFQNVIFTVIFGVIFVYKVLNTGNMPDFGVLELSLMGLSTATYVTLKTGENKAPANTSGGTSGGTQGGQQ